jgi:hypothetical protein
MRLMRFYLEFQGRPLATIDPKEIRKARESYFSRANQALLNKRRSS